MLYWLDEKVLEARKMAKKKIYAVKIGKKPGLYETWAECKKQIDGYSGAVYKGFTTKAEAEQFIGNNSAFTVAAEKHDNFNIDEYIRLLDDQTLVAFVDGSYNKLSKTYGYGVVLISKNNPLETLMGSDNHIDYVETRNVAGEIDGVKNAIRYGIEKGYKKIVLFYDYIGIEKWAIGDWKANAAISKDYIVFINQIKPSIEIEFRKVKAHSGIIYNELADELAKKSLQNKA